MQALSLTVSAPSPAGVGVGGGERCFRVRPSPLPALPSISCTSNSTMAVAIVDVFHSPKRHRPANQEALHPLATVASAAFPRDELPQESGHGIQTLTISKDCAEVAEGNDRGVESLKGHPVLSKDTEYKGKNGRRGKRGMRCEGHRKSAEEFHLDTVREYENLHLNVVRYSKDGPTVSETSAFEGGTVYEECFSEVVSSHTVKEYRVGDVRKASSNEALLSKAVTDYEGAFSEAALSLDADRGCEDMRNSSHCQEAGGQTATWYAALHCEASGEHKLLNGVNFMPLDGTKAVDSQNNTHAPQESGLMQPASRKGNDNWSQSKEQLEALQSRKVHEKFHQEAKVTSLQSSPSTTNLETWDLKEASTDSRNVSAGNCVQVWLTEEEGTDMEAKDGETVEMHLSQEQKIRMELNKSAALARRNLRICEENVTEAEANGICFPRFEKLLVEKTWCEAIGGEFQKAYMDRLYEYICQEAAGSIPIYPPPSKVFHAFNSCPLNKVKVVILGQDPYHRPDQAMGLSFSVEKGAKLPSSLMNIFKELKNDLNLPVPSDGNLEKWAYQGVLLLNTVLTVRDHHANSHAKKGWEPFTDAAIRAVAQQQSGVVFLLWGNSARDKLRIINRTCHHILMASHPSGFSATKGFFGSRHFSETNKLLEGEGKLPIDWQLQ